MPLNEANPHAWEVGQYDLIGFYGMPNCYTLGGLRVHQFEYAGGMQLGSIMWRE